jgi:hypothetical protein
VCDGIFLYKITAQFQTSFVCDVKKKPLCHIKPKNSDQLCVSAHFILFYCASPLGLLLMDNYVVLEHIGEGSFGKVYKVTISH